MVPNGWEIRSLSQVSKVIDCKHRTPHYVELGIPLISPGTIKWGALDLISPTKRVTEDEYQSLMDHCTVEVGDLVMSRNQSVGVLSFVDSNEPFVLGQDTVLIQPENSDSKYLFYKIQAYEVQKKIFRLAGGSTFSRINLADIRKLTFEYPPLLEQQKIAQILSTWDQAISATEKLLENSQQQKKALMQQLLTGKKRLFDGEKLFVDSWTKFKIREMGKITSGGTPDTGKLDYWDGTVPWLTPTDVTALKSAYVSSTSRKITELGVNESSAILLPKESLMVCTRATIGSMAISTVEMCTNQGFKNITPNKNFEVKFIYYLLSFNLKELLRKSSGSTFLELSKKDFENIELFCPSIKEQQKIAEILSVVDQEIETLQKKLDCLKQEKKALMQQLLTGKKRVKVAA